MAETPPGMAAKADVHFVDSTDTVGYLNLAVATTDYSIALPDGLWEVILDAAGGVAIGKYAATVTLPSDGSAPIAGFVVGPGFPRRIQGNATVHLKMPAGTGKAYFQRVQAP